MFMGKLKEVTTNIELKIFYERGIQNAYKRKGTMGDICHNYRPSHFV